MTQTSLMSAMPDPSGSAPAVASSTATERPRPVRTLTRRTLRDSGYSLLAFPLVITAFIVVVVLVSLGAGLLLVLVGLPILVAAAYVARGFAHLELWRIRTQLGEDAPTPRYVRPDPDEPWFRRMLTALRDQQAWLDVLWTLIAPATGLFASVLTFSAWVVVINGATSWFWQQWLPEDSGGYGPSQVFGLTQNDGLTILVNALAGFLVLLLLPFLTRVAARAHSGTALLLLSSRAGLQEEVRRATGGRDAARAAEASALRRLERDIHDGRSSGSCACPWTSVGHARRWTVTRTEPGRPSTPLTSRPGTPSTNSARSRAASRRRCWWTVGSARRSRNSSPGPTSRWTCGWTRTRPGDCRRTSRRPCTSSSPRP